MSDTTNNTSSLKDVLSRVVGEISQRMGMHGVHSPRAIWNKTSDARLKSHTHNVVLRKKKAMSILVVYMDSSAMMYEATMKSEMVVAEWNALCSYLDVDMRVDRAEFKLSSTARAHGENGSVTSLSVFEEPNPYDVVDLPTLDAATLNKINDTVCHIDDNRLKESVREAMSLSIRRKKMY